MLTAGAAKCATIPSHMTIHDCQETISISSNEGEVTRAQSPPPTYQPNLKITNTRYIPNESLPAPGHPSRPQERPASVLAETTRYLARLILHYFNLLWICCTSNKSTTTRNWSNGVWAWRRWLLTKPVSQYRVCPWICFLWRDITGISKSPLAMQMSPNPCRSLPHYTSLCSQCDKISATTESPPHTTSMHLMLLNWCKVTFPG